VEGLSMQMLNLIFCVILAKHLQIDLEREFQFFGSDDVRMTADSMKYIN
jgi:hypothetical protein